MRPVTTTRRNTAFIGLRLRPAQRVALEELAKRNERSMSGEVRRALDRYLDREVLER